MEILSRYLFILIPTGVIIAIVLLLIALFQDTKEFGRARAIRNAFFAIMAFLTFMTTFGSAVFLGIVLLRGTLFQDALKTTFSYNLTPPQLYLSSTKVEPTETKYTCTEGGACTLNDDQKTQVKNWAEDYQKWKKIDHISLQTRRDMVSGLSIFLVVVPLFILFYWVTNRAHRNGEKSAMRQVYFYGLAFTGLGVVVIGIGTLLNVGLKTWLIPQDTDKASSSVIEPITDTQQPLAVKSCINTCSLPKEYDQVIAEWQADVKKINDDSRKANPFHDDYAGAIPAVVFGAGTFVYHFMKIRREDSEGKKPGKKKA